MEQASPAPFTPGLPMPVSDGPDYLAEISRLRAENAALKSDALRWRALMQSQRMRVLGLAGFGSNNHPPDMTGYRHIGIEFWTKHDSHESIARDHEYAKQMLLNYIDVMLAVNPQLTIPCDPE